MPFVTTTVQLPSAHARSSAGVDGFIGFIGFTAVGDGGEEGFVGVGEAGDDSAEREGAAGAGAPASPPESEPQPVSAAARARAQTVPAGPRAADSLALALRRRANDSDVVMAPFYTRVPGTGPGHTRHRQVPECGHHPWCANLMSELYRFEIEPEVRAWLQGLSSHDFKRVDEVADLLAELRPALGGPWSDHLEGPLRELRLRR
ncbi:hypothetical protein ACGH7X_23865 [Streptomyces sp. BBFR51]|uniref:hypothetical protein n=1 Tax=Streptomyces sp. BBFR51 TaxID=3372856 RepID=UPI0037DC1173